jgi:hypothetical protein
MFSKKEAFPRHEVVDLVTSGIECQRFKKVQLKNEVMSLR